MNLFQSLVRWFYNTYCKDGPPILVKAFLWAFTFVFSWGILNNYDWGLVYVLKKAFVIWFVGFLSFSMAEMKLGQ